MGLALALLERRKGLERALRGTLTGANMRMRSEGKAHHQQCPCGVIKKDCRCYDEHCKANKFIELCN